MPGKARIGWSWLGRRGQERLGGRVPGCRSQRCGLLMTRDWVSFIRIVFLCWVLPVVSAGLLIRGMK